MPAATTIHHIDHELMTGAVLHIPEERGVVSDQWARVMDGNMVNPNTAIPTTTHVTSPRVTRQSSRQNTVAPPTVIPVRTQPHTVQPIEVTPVVTPQRNITPVTGTNVVFTNPATVTTAPPPLVTVSSTSTIRQALQSPIMTPVFTTASAVVNQSLPLAVCAVTTSTTTPCVSTPLVTVRPSAGNTSQGLTQRLLIPSIVDGLIERIVREKPATDTPAMHNKCVPESGLAEETKTAADRSLIDNVTGSITHRRVSAKSTSNTTSSISDDAAENINNSAPVSQPSTADRGIGTKSITARQDRNVNRVSIEESSSPTVLNTDGSSPAARDDTQTPDSTCESESTVSAIPEDLSINHGDVQSDDDSYPHDSGQTLAMGDSSDQPSHRKKRKTPKRTPLNLNIESFTKRKIFSKPFTGIRKTVSRLVESKPVFMFHKDATLELLFLDLYEDAADGAETKERNKESQLKMGFEIDVGFPEPGVVSQWMAAIGNDISSAASDAAQLKERDKGQSEKESTKQSADDMSFHIKDVRSLASSDTATKTRSSVNPSVVYIDSVIDDVDVDVETVSGDEDDVTAIVEKSTVQSPAEVVQDEIINEMPAEKAPIEDSHTDTDATEVQPSDTAIRDDHEQSRQKEKPKSHKKQAKVKSPSKKARKPKKAVKESNVSKLKIDIPPSYQIKDLRVVLENIDVSQYIQVAKKSTTKSALKQVRGRMKAQAKAVGSASDCSSPARSASPAGSRSSGRSSPASSMNKPMKKFARKSITAMGLVAFQKNRKPHTGSDDESNHSSSDTSNIEKGKMGRRKPPVVNVTPDLRHRRWSPRLARAPVPKAVEDILKNVDLKPGRRHGTDGYNSSSDASRTDDTRSDQGRRVDDDVDEEFNSDGGDDCSTTSHDTLSTKTADVVSDSLAYAYAEDLIPEDFENTPARSTPPKKRILKALRSPDSNLAKVCEPPVSKSSDKQDKPRDEKITRRQSVPGTKSVHIGVTTVTKPDSVPCKAKAVNSVSEQSSTTQAQKIPPSTPSVSTSQPAISRPVTTTDSGVSPVVTTTTTTQDPLSRPPLGHKLDDKSKPYTSQATPTSLWTEVVRSSLRKPAAIDTIQSPVPKSLPPPLPQKKRLSLSDYRKKKGQAPEKKDSTEAERQMSDPIIEARTFQKDVLRDLDENISSKDSTPDTDDDLEHLEEMQKHIQQELHKMEADDNDDNDDKVIVLEKNLSIVRSLEESKDKGTSDDVLKLFDQLKREFKRPTPTSSTPPDSTSKSRDPRLARKKSPVRDRRTDSPASAVLAIMKATSSTSKESTKPDQWAHRPPLSSSYQKQDPLQRKGSIDLESALDQTKRDRLRAKEKEDFMSDNNDDEEELYDGYAVDAHGQTEGPQTPGSAPSTSSHHLNWLPQLQQLGGAMPVSHDPKALQDQVLSVIQNSADTRQSKLSLQSQQPIGVDQLKRVMDTVKTLPSPPTVGPPVLPQPLSTSKVPHETWKQPLPPVQPDTFRRPDTGERRGSFDKGRHPGYDTGLGQHRRLSLEQDHGRSPRDMAGHSPLEHPGHSPRDITAIHAHSPRDLAGRSSVGMSPTVRRGSIDFQHPGSSPASGHSPRSLQGHSPSRSVDPARQPVVYNVPWRLIPLEVPEQCAWFSAESRVYLPCPPPDDDLPVDPRGETHNYRRLKLMMEKEDLEKERMKHSVKPPSQVKAGDSHPTAKGGDLPRDLQDMRRYLDDLRTRQPELNKSQAKKWRRKEIRRWEAMYSAQFSHHETGPRRSSTPTTSVPLSSGQIPGLDPVRGVSESPKARISMPSEDDEDEEEEATDTSMMSMDISDDEHREEGELSAGEDEAVVVSRKQSSHSHHSQKRILSSATDFTERKVNLPTDTIHTSERALYRSSHSPETRRKSEDRRGSHSQAHQRGSSSPQRDRGRSPVKRRTSQSQEGERMDYGEADRISLQRRRPGERPGVRNVAKDGEMISSCWGHRYRDPDQPPPNHTLEVGGIDHGVQMKMEQVEQLSPTRRFELDQRTKQLFGLTLNAIQNKKTFHDPTQGITSQRRMKLIRAGSVNPKVLEELKIEHDLDIVDNELDVLSDELEGLRYIIAANKHTASQESMCETFDYQMRVAMIKKEILHRKMEELNRYQKSAYVELLPSTLRLAEEVGKFVSVEGVLLFLTLPLDLADCQLLAALKQEICDAQDALRHSSLSDNDQRMSDLLQRLGWLHIKRKTMLNKICCPNEELQRRLREKFVGKLSSYR